MIEFLVDAFGDAQQWLFESAIQPLMFHAGLGSFLEDGYTATGWLMVGIIQLCVLLAVIGPLERWRPVEPVVDRRAIRTDVLYTLVHRLGLFRVALFFLVEPFFDEGIGALRVLGLPTFHLDAVLPGITDQPVLSLLIYLLAFDFLEYLIHRGQHGFEWWWRLHALHHSQRQMTMWSDNRNHLLDDVLHDSIVVLVGQLIGVGPEQFVAIVALTQLSENFHHANLRLWFGRVGERLWVSPRFHRLHHAIGIGHESPDGQALRSVNYGVLLPWWDMLLGTANFDLRYEPTGIRDQVEPDTTGRLRDYGRGFWSQQWLGVKRLVGRD